ncbi:MAG: hypothetical protein K8L91_23355 [Anaerolineae bacterium]|nr:hypothetical protein [Anaerolineae bacterium]
MLERWVLLDRVGEEIEMTSGIGGEIPAETRALVDGELTRLKLNFTNLLLHVYYTPRLNSQDAIYYSRVVVQDGAFSDET